MGRMKKKVRADVRRAARLVLAKYYRETTGKTLNEKRMKALVRKTERKVVPAIFEALKNEDGVETEALTQLEEAAS